MTETPENVVWKYEDLTFTVRAIHSQQMELYSSGVNNQGSWAAIQNNIRDLGRQMVQICDFLGIKLPSPLRANPLVFYGAKPFEFCVIGSEKDGLVAIRTPFWKEQNGPDYVPFPPTIDELKILLFDLA